MRDDIGKQDGETAYSPAAVYEARCADFASRRDAFERQWSRLANIRFALFVAIVICFGLGAWRGSWLWLLGATFFLAGFVVAVVRHRRLAHLRDRYAALWAINAEGLLRLRRDWNNLPLRAPADQSQSHPLAVDLDLLGHASLQHLLSATYTSIGQTTLQRWLLHPATPSVVRERQAGVADLAPRVDLRDDLSLRGGRMQGQQSGYEALLAWAEGPPLLPAHPWLHRLAIALPLATLSLWLAWLAGAIPYPLWGITILASWTLTAVMGRPVEETLDRISAHQSVFRAYADLFALLRTTPVDAARLRQLQETLDPPGAQADHAMRRLQRLMGLADLRMWLLFPVVQILSLWTVHVLWLLERWQRHAGRHARAWLETLGEFEALAALAALKHDHPRWTFPQIGQDASSLIVARSLGHPLLAPERCVGNDVELGPPGTFLLVTGSNMSGKSTLLRAIGVNIVLAQAGGPVCATLLRMPPVILATSMRVQDSLEQGVSYFMAELLRLKQVVDIVASAETDKEATVVFLLDEILHGTNTRERQIASRAIIQRLLDLGATGAVSTHDLALVDSSPLAARSRPVHFAETFLQGPDGPTLRFDYLLRDGIATSTNALKLMELVGLGDTLRAEEPIPGKIS